MVKAKKFVIKKHFQGEPQARDLRIEEEELLPLKDGEILLQAEYISVDPYMRPFGVHYPLGHTMIGHQVGLIIESRNPKWPVGKRVVAFVGWRTLTVLNPDKIVDDPIPVQRPVKRVSPFQLCRLLTDYDDLPHSLALGMLGLTGLCAYYGFFDICQPRVGETIVISTAAGAIGSHVGQLAKMQGMKVIGLTSTDAKCRWLVEELGFDHAINYKTDIGTALKKAAPNGIDCYFDNVGGEISSHVIQQMREEGRISVCGCISIYNSNTMLNGLKLPNAPILQPRFIFSNLKMEGFFVDRYAAKLDDSIAKNLHLIREGKLRYKETITHGFENTFKAFVGMLNGENSGKAIVKI